MRSKSKGVAKGTERHRVARLYRAIGNKIQSMSDEDFERLIGGERFEIRLLGERDRKCKGTPSLSRHELESVASGLSTATSREEAGRMIDQRLHTKTDLLAFAEHLGIGVPKSTTSIQLRERLIETTVGYRINTAAILGTNPDSPGKASSMRDPQLLLDLLRQMAAHPDGRLTNMRVHLGMGEGERKRKHHVEILTDAGHVEWSEPLKHPRITASGYDFIEAVDKNKDSMKKFLALLDAGIPYLRAAKAALDLLTA